MPFPRNADFVGRSDDLDRLHAVLQDRRPVGIRPAGLTGMGGIGKTQLAVEYVYLHKADYPGGLFWVNAAEPLAQGLAQIGARLRPETLDQSANHQLRAAFAELNRRPDALIVFDNIEDPAQLDRPVGLEGSPSTLACRILFTTRRPDLDRFESVEITVLPEEAALQLLLRHHSRRAVRDDPAHPERAEARSICRLLGGLPLAVKLAGAFLAEWPEVSLADYRKRLQEEGCIPSVDNEAANLTTAVAATLKTQWDALKPEDDAPRLLLRVAGQFGEATAISVATLGLFAGVSPAQRPGYPSPLRRALKRLYAVRLVEELEANRVRLHPLVREFAAALTPPAETAEFRHACAGRVAGAFEKLSAWEEFVGTDGIDGLELCLAVAREFAEHAEDGVGDILVSMLRLVRREAHHLREWDPENRPNGFAQQVQFRAVTFGVVSVAEIAEHQLGQLARPCLLLRWRTLNESPALLRILTGHQGLVSSVAVTPDGRRIVSASYDKTVAIWDLDSGTRIRQLSGHREGVSSVAVSPDGRRIISGSDDKLVAVWDLESGIRICQLAGHQEGVSSVAMSPDGRRIVSASYDGTVAIWDLESGDRIRQLSGHQFAVTSVVVSPDGRRIVSASYDKTVAVWDLESGARLHRLSGHRHWVRSVAVSPDGQCIVSASYDKTVAVWDLESGARIHQLSGHRRSVTSTAMSPDGRRIVSASYDKTVLVWDLESGASIRQLSGHQDPVSSVAWAPDGRHIVSGSYDNSLAVWDLESGAHIRQLTGHQAGVSSVAASPDGRRIVSGSDDHTVAVWDLESGARIHQLCGHQEWVNSVAVSPDGRSVVSGSSDHIVAVWDLESGTLIHRLSGHHEGVRSVAVSPDGRRIVSGSDDHTLAVWDFESGTLIHRLSGHQAAVSSVAMSPDGRRIVSGSYDKTLAIWDLKSGTHIRRLTGHQSLVSSAAVSPDGRRIVSGSDDKTVAVWDLESGSRIHSLTWHQNEVNSVAVSPDGRRIVSGSDDKTVAVWDLESGRGLASVALDGSVASVAWHRDGRSILAGDAHGNLYRLEYREP